MEQKTPIASGSTNSTPNSVETGETSRLGKLWKVSDKALEFIATWENGVSSGLNYSGQMVTDGFILTVYNDSRKKPTVGCGHLVVDADKLKLGNKITLEMAKEFLKNDLKIAEGAVNDFVDVPLYQHEYDSFVSIAFNTGRAGFKKLATSVNSGEYKKIPAIIEKYRTGGGNEKRRKSESKLFELGVYDATH